MAPTVREMRQGAIESLLTQAQALERAARDLHLAADRLEDQARKQRNDAKQQLDLLSKDLLPKEDE